MERRRERGNEKEVTPPSATLQPREPAWGSGAFVVFSSFLFHFHPPGLSLFACFLRTVLVSLFQLLQSLHSFSSWMAWFFSIRARRQESSLEVNGFYLILLLFLRNFSSYLFFLSLLISSLGLAPCCFAKV